MIRSIFTNRWILGCVGFLILFVTVSVFWTMHNRADIARLKQELVDAKELEQHMNQQPEADNKPPRPAKDGHKWEWHGDHWHEMPIAQSDAPQQPPASEKIVFEPFELKSDLPDELPEKFPTDKELRKMTYGDLNHLRKLYEKAALDLEKTDYFAGVQLYNETVPKIWKIQHEIHDRVSADVMAEHEAFVKTLPIEIPATEDRTGVIIEVAPSPNKGGK